jgi:hypothetical protein
MKVLRREITEADIQRFAKRVHGRPCQLKTKDIEISLILMADRLEFEKDTARRNKIKAIMKDMRSVIRIIKKKRIQNAKAA